MTQQSEYCIAVLTCQLFHCEHTWSNNQGAGHTGRAPEDSSGEEDEMQESQTSWPRPRNHALYTTIDHRRDDSTWEGEGREG